MRVLLLLAVLLAAGCSMTIQGPPSDLPPQAPPYCDRCANGRLTADVVGAIASVAAAQMMGCGIHQTGEIFDDDPTPCEFYPAALVAAVPWVFVAALGVQRVKACNRAWERYEERYPRVPTAQENAARQQALRECEAELAPWRRELDLRRKTELWNQLSPRCQAAVSR